MDPVEKYCGLAGVAQQGVPFLATTRFGMSGTKQMAPEEKLNELAGAAQLEEPYLARFRLSRTETMDLMEKRYGFAVVAQQGVLFLAIPDFKESKQP